MRGLLFVFTLGLVFFAGCQTLVPSVNTPFTKEWIGEYNRLKSLPPSLETCENFKTLALKDFPLNEFARLRGSLHCEEILSSSEEAKPWLYEIWTETKLSLAEKKSTHKSIDKENLVSLLLERSKQIPLKEEKVKLVMRAQKEAQKLSDDIKKQIEVRLFELAPRFNPNYPPHEALKVAKDFLSARNFTESRKIYLKILNQKDSKLSQKMLAFEGLARLEKLERDKEDHANSLLMYAQFLKQQEKKKLAKSDRRLLLKKIKSNEIEVARALWTVGRRPEAEKILNERVSQTIKLFSYSTYYWLLGRIEEEKKNTESSLNFLRLALKETQEDSQLEGQTHWFLAWNLFKSQSYPEAIEHLKWFETSKSDDFTKARAKYWTGISLLKLNEQDEARKTLESLSQFDPLGYYGLMAKRELKETLKKPLPKENTSDSYFFRRKLQKVYHPEWVTWMHQMGEKEALKNYMNVVAKSYAKSKDQEDDVWLQIFKSYAKAGEYLGLFQKLYEIKPQTRDRLLKDHPDLLFPTPHLTEIMAASAQFNVEPELIYSIIRQESAFNPEARSPADAFGLMQLLPRVGEKMGKEIDVSVTHYTDLFEPEKNILLGTYLIANQRKRHKGHFISTVASYNASDSAVKGWLTSRGRDSMVEFIEEIPYEETKGYARLIIRNYVFYRLFLSPHSEISFPEELLSTTAL